MLIEEAEQLRARIKHDGAAERHGARDRERLCKIAGDCAAVGAATNATAATAAATTTDADAAPPSFADPPPAAGRASSHAGLYSRDLGLYPWVLRLRPDLFLPCTLPHLDAALAAAAMWYAYK